MISTAILCSGQGAQSAAMFDLLADAPEAEPVFLAAKRALSGKDPRDVVHQASSEAIHLDKAGQILCCTQAMAAWTVIGPLLARPLLVAGYSVGELSAWGVAGLMSVSRVLDLAVQRAEAMDSATTEPSGLVAIRGLTQTALLPICKSHGAYIAIINASDQFLVGGTQASLARVIVDAMAAGAVRTTMLPVAVASHTPLLAAASTMFRQRLMSTPMLSTVPAGVRLLSGIDGAAVFDVRLGTGKLACQIQQTVDWAACIDSCRAAGVTKIIELGPGSALAHLVHEAMPYADVHSLSEFHSRAGFVQWASNESRGATA